MPSVRGVAVLFLAASAAASVYGAGLSGLAADAGFAQGNVDFGAFVGGDVHVRLASHFALAFPFRFAFPLGGTAFYGGGEVRIYFRGDAEQLVQPFAAGGGGFYIPFSFSGSNGSDFYTRAGGGAEFNLPGTFVTPFMEGGGLVVITGGPPFGGYFEGGVRFDVW